MPQDPNTMYRWRQWTPEQRQIILDERLQRKHPPHSPPHIVSDHTSIYMITAACYEHRPIIGTTNERLAAFSDNLCHVMLEQGRHLFAWVVLPNHYHALVDVIDLKLLFLELGKLHGRMSYLWNGEESTRGRKVWCNSTETVMKSEGHFYATVNYILNNPVHHRYCSKWTDWPFSNAVEYLEAIGREKALRYWNSYPIYDYGKAWDPPDM